MFECILFWKAVKSGSLSLVGPHLDKKLKFTAELTDFFFFEDGSGLFFLILFFFYSKPKKRSETNAKDQKNRPNKTRRKAKQ